MRHTVYISNRFSPLVLFYYSDTSTTSHQNPRRSLLLTIKSEIQIIRDSGANNVLPEQRPIHRIVNQPPLDEYAIFYFPEIDFRYGYVGDREGSMEGEEETTTT